MQNSDQTSTTQPPKRKSWESMCLTIEGNKVRLIFDLTPTENEEMLVGQDEDVHSFVRYILDSRMSIGWEPFQVQRGNDDFPQRVELKRPIE